MNKMNGKRVPPVRGPMLLFELCPSADMKVRWCFAEARGGGGAAAAAPTSAWVHLELALPTTNLQTLCFRRQRQLTPLVCAR